MVIESTIFFIFCEPAIRRKPAHKKKKNSRLYSHMAIYFNIFKYLFKLLNFILNAREYVCYTTGQITVKSIAD